MKLDKKKALAARTFGVGKKRIVLVKERLEEIKEAITKQDIKELYQDKAILIKQVKGKRRIMRKQKRRSVGKTKKKLNARKQNYVKLTRKLRAYVAEMKKQNKLSIAQAKEIRKKIRNKAFRSKAHLREYIGGLK